MNTRRRILSVALAAVLAVCPLLFGGVETVLAADLDNTNEGTFTAADGDEASYEALKKALNGSSNATANAVQFDDDAKTVTVQYDKVKYFYLNMPQTLSSEAQSFITSIFSSSTNLETVILVLRNAEQGSGIDVTGLDGKQSLKQLELVNFGFTEIPVSAPELTKMRISGCDFSNASFAKLNDTNLPKLTTLMMCDCKLTAIPDIKLSNLEELVLSKNDFSASGACGKLTSANFPKLERLYLDVCKISDVSFLQSMTNNTLANLSMGRNRLENGAADSLIGMKDSALANLVNLNIGGGVYEGGSGRTNSDDANSNHIDVDKMVALLNAFPGIKEMDLSNFSITSLEPFKDFSDKDIKIDFRYNKIADFSGYEKGNKADYILSVQNSTLLDKYSPGQEYELPELLQRILDSDDVLNGTLEYQNCGLSDDGTKLVIRPNVGGASIRVTSGRIFWSTINLTLKKVPKYEIPQGLTATVGDKLSDVALPAGFAWKNDAQEFDAGGNHTFEAVFTPDDTEEYAVVAVDVPVTVKRLKPSYTVPQGLTAAAGDTLANVALPEGFTWKDAGLSVGTEGSRTFKAVFTPQDTDRYEIVDDINVPLTVTAADPTKPNEPETNPSEPTKPSEPETNPSEATKPNESETNPSEAVKPNESETNPSEPSKPGETEAPAEEYDEDMDGEAQTPAKTVDTSDTSPILPAAVLLFVSGMILCITVSDKKNGSIKK